MTQPVFQGAIKLLKEESVERIAGGLAIVAVGSYLALEIAFYLDNIISPILPFLPISHGLAGILLGISLAGILLGIFFGLIFKQSAKQVVILVPLILLIRSWVYDYNYFSSGRYEGIGNFSLINTTFGVLSDARGLIHLFLLPYAAFATIRYMDRHPSAFSAERFSAIPGMAKNWVKQQSIGSMLIMASLLIAIVSMCMNWVENKGLDALLDLARSKGLAVPRNSSVGPSILDISIFIGCWLYPIAMLFKNKSINFWIGLAGSSISLLWSASIIRNVYYATNDIIDISVGLGLWLYALAAIVLLIGVIASRQARQSVV